MGNPFLKIVHVVSSSLGVPPFIQPYPISTYSYCADIVQMQFSPWQKMQTLWAMSLEPSSMWPLAGFRPCPTMTFLWPGSSRIRGPLTTSPSYLGMVTIRPVSQPSSSKIYHNRSLTLPDWIPTTTSSSQVSAWVFQEAGWFVAPLLSIKGQAPSRRILESESRVRCASPGVLFLNSSPILLRH